MRSVRLTPAARKDLADIRRYTLRRWGREQANAYIRAFNATFGRLADGNLAGSPADEIRPGHLRMRSGSHVIFYRADASTIRIVRVLHERMDFGAHL